MAREAAQHPIVREQLGTATARRAERDPGHAFVALRARDAYGAELRGPRAVRAAARREVELADRDHANIGGHLGIAAELQRGELVGPREPRADREVIVDDVV